MNILIKLTCLVGLAIAPILGSQLHSSQGGIIMQTRENRFPATSDHVLPGNMMQTAPGAPPPGEPIHTPSNQPQPAINTVPQPGTPNRMLSPQEKEMERKRLMENPQGTTLGRTPSGH